MFLLGYTVSLQVIANHVLSIHHASPEWQLKEGWLCEQIISPLSLMYEMGVEIFHLNSQWEISWNMEGHLQLLHYNHRPVQFVSPQLGRWKSPSPNHCISNSCCTLLPADLLSVPLTESSVSRRIANPV